MNKFIIPAITGMVSAVAITSAVVIANPLTSASDSASIPPGAVIPFASSNCPAGYSDYNNANGRALVGSGYFAQNFRGSNFSHNYAPGSTGGIASYKLGIDEIPAHHHTIAIGDSNNMGSPGISQSLRSTGTETTSQAGGGLAFDNRQPWIALKMCVKQ